MDFFLKQALHAVFPHSISEGDILSGRHQITTSHYFQYPIHVVLVNIRANTDTQYQIGASPFSNIVFGAAYIRVRTKTRLLASAKCGRERCRLECKGSLGDDLRENKTPVKTWREKNEEKKPLPSRGEAFMSSASTGVLLRCNVKVGLANVWDVCYYWVISQAGIPCSNTRAALGPS